MPRAPEVGRSNRKCVCGVWQFGVRGYLSESCGAGARARGAEPSPETPCEALGSCGRRGQCGPGPGTAGVVLWKQDVDWLLGPGGNNYRSPGGFRQQRLLLPQLRGQGLGSVLLAFGGDAGFGARSCSPPVCFCGLGIVPVCLPVRTQSCWNKGLSTPV